MVKINKKKLRFFLIIIGFLGVMLCFNLIFKNDDSKLCIYEVPGHLKMNCSMEEKYKVVNFYEPTIFSYNNAKEQGCEFYEIGNSSYSNFYINKCDLEIEEPIILFSS